MALPASLNGHEKSAAILVKALKDFGINFKKAGKAEWMKVKDSYIARFEINGKQRKDWSDLNGRWNAAVDTYGEFALPKYISRMVRTNYFEF